MGSHNLPEQLISPDSDFELPTSFIVTSSIKLYNIVFTIYTKTSAKTVTHFKIEMNE